MDYRFDDALERRREQLRERAAQTASSPPAASSSEPYRSGTVTTEKTADGKTKRFITKRLWLHQDGSVTEDKPGASTAKVGSVEMHRKIDADTGDYQEWILAGGKWIENPSGVDPNQEESGIAHRTNLAKLEAAEAQARVATAAADPKSEQAQATLELTRANTKKALGQDPGTLLAQRTAQAQMEFEREREETRKLIALGEIDARLGASRLSQAQSRLTMELQREQNRMHAAQMGVTMRGQDMDAMRSARSDDTHYATAAMTQWAAMAKDFMDRDISPEELQNRKLLVQANQPGRGAAWYAANRVDIPYRKPAYTPEDLIRIGNEARRSGPAVQFQARPEMPGPSEAVDRAAGAVAAVNVGERPPIQFRTPVVPPVGVTIPEPP